MICNCNGTSCSRGVAERAEARFRWTVGLSASDVATMVHMMWLGAEAMQLLGFEEAGIELRPVLRRIGAMIATLGGIARCGRWNRSPPDGSSNPDDGCSIAWEAFGTDGPAVMLLPPWMIVHSRQWKFQIPFLARRHRVVTFDPRGNGASGRTRDPRQHRADRFVGDALAVLDACGTRTRNPDRQLRRLPARPRHRRRTPGPRGRARAACVLTARFGATAGPGLRLTSTPSFEDPQGWELFTRAAWLEEYARFVRFFFERCLSEPHSTKAWDDCVGWALETDGATLAASIDGGRDDWFFSPDGDLRSLQSCAMPDARGPRHRGPDHMDRVRPPRLRRDRRCAVPGDRRRRTLSARSRPGAHEPGDRALSRRGVPAAASSAGVVTRHEPPAQGALRLVADRARSRAPRHRHRRRARQLLCPDLEIDWLAQHPVTAVLENEQRRVHPASAWLASESQHFAERSCEHDLHAFQAFREMDEILLANFHIFQRAVEDGSYDLVVADEAWDIDHFWFENPELKRAPLAWMTDFVGYLPMPSGGDAGGVRRRRLQRRDDRARRPLPEHARPCDLRRRSRGHRAAALRGRPARDPGVDRGALRVRGIHQRVRSRPGSATATSSAHELGFAPDETVCVVAVGGSGVGTSLLRRAVDAFDPAEGGDALACA